jgi:uncharacterized phage protein gp47/JayE
MSFTRPTLPEIVDRVEGDFLARVTGVAAILRRSVIKVLARVVAGAEHMMHGHLAYLGDQLFPDKSDGDFLKRQASLFGLSLDPPIAWKGTAGITGTNGSTAPAGSVLRNAGGFEYTVDADVTISGGVGTLALTAVVAGADSQMAVADTAAFESPIAGINATATVASVTLDGVDQETIDGLRSRTLERMSDPPTGGNVADFKAWVRKVFSNAKVWVYPDGGGPGTVWVRFARIDTDGSILIPSGGEVTAVQSYLDGDDVKPAYATVTVIAPTAAPLAVTFSALNPNTQAVKDAITAEITDFLNRVAAPGATVYLSELRTAIGEAAGLVDYTMTVPAADVTHTANQIATVGVITFP